MKSLLITVLLFSFSAFGVIDSQLSTKPNREFMNFFLDGYLDWHEKSFGMRPDTGSKEGNLFLKEAISKIDHWRTPENNKLDQFLIGEGFDTSGKPYYNFRLYIAEELRDHSFLRSFQLPFKPRFIEMIKEDGLCFVGPVSLDEITWKSVPKFHKSVYLQHYCKLPGEKIQLKKISYLSNIEEGSFPHPFQGQVDFELRRYSAEKLESVLLFVRTTHTILMLPRHLPYINKHGVSALIPFDKFSVNASGDMVIYYP